MKRRSLLGITGLILSILIPLSLNTSAQAAGTSVILAGTGTGGFSGDGGPASAAQLNGPASIAISNGVITVADSGNRRLRQIGQDSTINTVNGDGSACGGIGDIAQPTKGYCGGVMTSAPDGTLYYADGSGIGKTAPGGANYHYAGRYFGLAQYGDGGKYDVTTQPADLAYDASTGNVVFTQGHAIQAVTTTGQIVTLAGTTSDCNTGSDDTMPAVGACLWPRHIAVQNGRLYFTEQSSWNGPRARMIDGADLKTLAGNGSWNEPTLGGPAISSGFPDMGGITVDSRGTVYLSGMQRGRVWAVSPDDLTLSLVTEFEGGANFMTTDPAGNLYVSLQYKNQVAKISGLVNVPPPIPDGKQHGKVTGVTWAVTPTTKLWTLDVSVNTTAVTCPATLSITFGSWQRKPVLCKAGETAPSTFNFPWKVFSTTQSLPPGQNVLVMASVVKSDAARYGSADTVLPVPVAPVWVGLGDSYSSGHHQDKDNINCLPVDIPLTGPCYPDSLTANDPSFSWVTRATTKLNLNVPAEWKLSTLVLAQSGSSTSDIINNGQLEQAVRTLSNRAMSWNIVSFTGGANDIQFSSALNDFYYAHKPAQRVSPWNVQKWSDCPNTEALFQHLTSDAPLIQQNLATITDTIRRSSSAIRFIDVLYPYVVKPGNICESDKVVPSSDLNGQASTWHGARSVIDLLDTLHMRQNQPDVLSVDLRQTYSGDPTSYAQKTRYYGYPHPNASGQAKIASAVVNVLQR